MSRDLIVGLDLGSYVFRMIAARPDDAAPEGIEVIGVASVPARGIRRGALVSIDEVARAVGYLRSDIERQVASVVPHAFVAVGGPHISSLLSRGLVVVSRPDNRIGDDDIRRVLEAAGAVSFGQNSEVLAVVPREFFVDGEGGIKDVAGMQGRRLEAEAVVLAAASPHLKNLSHALSTSEIDSHEFVAGPVATARAVLTARPRELGVAVVDIGHGTTDVAVYEEGDLLAVSILPIGGGHITNDIAIGLRCSIDAAERAKHEYGTANPGEIAKKEMIDVGTLDPAQEGESFSRRELAEIIEARVDEILELVGKEIKRIERWRLLPAGIVLTGGTANLPGIVDATRRSFHLPVQLGYPTITQGPKEVVSGFSYTTALGLVLTGADVAGRRRGGMRFPHLPNLKGFSGGSLGGRVKRLFRAILP